MFKTDDNDLKFAAVRSLRLPPKHYAITSSGVLGIRGLRAIGDVDVIVDDQLWAQLASRYRVTRDSGFDRIAIGDYLEIFGRDSFLAPRSHNPHNVNNQIATAEVIDQLPFVRLEHVLHFKRHVLLPYAGRTKQRNDRSDIDQMQTLLTRPATIT